MLALLAAAMLGVAAQAQNVTLRAVNRPADEVFAALMKQTGKNFIYSADLLTGVRVNVDANRRPLRKVLAEMFAGTDIEYKIKGDNVTLKRRSAKVSAAPERQSRPSGENVRLTIDNQELPELTVVSRLNAPEVQTCEVGARKVTPEDISGTPMIFGETDIMKTLQMQPGVVAGTDGSAAMHVHGGASDENLFLLDNVPLYHVNHLGGLFSAFNTDMVRYVDFYKSSIPAKYDGRLSSVMDVRTFTGIPDKFKGSLRLGITSASLNFSGPIGENTSYAVGMRRSWYDALLIPIIKIAQSDSEKGEVQYYFMDLNAKLTHRFSPQTSAFVSLYFGDDLFKLRNASAGDMVFFDNRTRLHWGNVLAQTGVNHRFNSDLSAEFTAAFTRYFSGLRMTDENESTFGKEYPHDYKDRSTGSGIHDYILRSDFRLAHSEGSTLRFGASVTHHEFLPSRIDRMFYIGGDTIMSQKDVRGISAEEGAVYAENEWHPAENLFANVGLNASTFLIDGRFKGGLSPRASLSWNIRPDWAVKGAYTHTTQYVHMLSQTHLALPSDRWIPVSGSFKPQTADKLSAGLYHEFSEGRYSAGVEAYYKYMRNLVEYKEDFYMSPPADMWSSQICSGRGTAKGIDFQVEKHSGKLTGHIAYSLAWADRTFAEKNSGHTYPARFDNRHTVKLLVNWDVSSRVQLNAAWTGHSGNRFTFATKQWLAPEQISLGYDYVNMRTPLNNCHLPFYHRLDLSCTVNMKRGYWNFSIYNAYNRRNPIAFHYYEGKLKFVGSLPIIPSLSYTWKFGK